MSARRNLRGNSSLYFFSFKRSICPATGLFTEYGQQRVVNRVTTIIFPLPILGVQVQLRCCGMNRNTRKTPLITRQTSRIDDDDTGQPGLQEFRDSPDYYEHRSKIGFKLGPGDWWIVVGVYLVIVSVGLVIL